MTRCGAMIARSRIRRLSPVTGSKRLRGPLYAASPVRPQVCTVDKLSLSCETCQISGELHRHLRIPVEFSLILKSRIQQCIKLRSNANHKIFDRLGRPPSTLSTCQTAPALEPASAPINRSICTFCTGLGVAVPAISSIVSIRPQVSSRDSSLANGPSFEASTGRAAPPATACTTPVYDVPPSLHPELPQRDKHTQQTHTSLP